MNKKISIDFNSSLNQIVAFNKHFDRGTLRIAYHGLNRNGSEISKDSFEKAIIKSLFYTPVVTHLLDNGELGGHDSEIMIGDNGEISQRYLTTPVGLVPENANYWWELVQEDSGELHEYLCTETLLWKRQDAYNKIKQDGFVKHSMEIDVETYELNGNVFVIKDFTFTAFTLIGVEPCFESSGLTLFSLDKEKFKQEFSDMIKELKENEVIEDMEDNTIDVVEVETVETIEEVIEEVVETEEIVDEVIEETVEVVEEVEETIEEPTVVEDVVEEVAPELSIEEKYTILQNEFAELQLKHSEMEKEFERLSKFEKETLDEKLAKDKEDMFAKYSNVLTGEEMQEIKDNSEKYSLNDIEVHLNKIIAEKTISTSGSKKFSKSEGLLVAEPKKDKMKNRYAI